VRAATVLLISLCFLNASAQPSSGGGGIPVVRYAVRVDQPAYAGEPIWVYTEPNGRINYPFRTGIGDFGCNRLELLREGKLVPPRQLHVWGDVSGILCGFVAPPNAPTDRLPLHVWYPSLGPGKYAVRWISQTPDFAGAKTQLANSVSGWTMFMVSKPSEEQREAWLEGLLVNVPSDPGKLAGDYIPALVAAAPDDRALRAVAEQLYSNNQVVARLAASALQVFPEDRVNALLPQLIQTQGPSDVLAYLVSAEPLRKYQPQMTKDCIQNLNSVDANRTAAAIKTLGFFFHLPSNGYPSNSDLAAAADAAVLQAAPLVIASGQAEEERQLAQYLGVLQQPEAHEWLWQIASARGAAAEQAQIALTWNSIPDDLPRLAALLVSPGDPDSMGQDLSLIPHSLMRSYGDEAIAWLEKAIADSPYVWVRTASAEELARRNDPAAFHFFLDAITSQRFYKEEMIRFLKDAFPSDLNRNADDKAVTTFLSERLPSR